MTKKTKEPSLKNQKLVLEIKHLNRPFYYNPSFVAIILGFFGFMTAQINGCYDKEKKSLRIQVVDLQNQKVNLKESVAQISKDKDSIEKNKLASEKELQKLSKKINLYKEISQKNEEIESVAFDIIEFVNNNFNLSTEASDYLLKNLNKLEKLNLESRTLKKKINK